MEAASPPHYSFCEDTRNEKTAFLRLKQPKIGQCVTKLQLTDKSFGNRLINCLTLETCEQSQFILNSAPDKGGKKKKRYLGVRGETISWANACQFGISAAGHHGRKHHGARWRRPPGQHRPCQSLLPCTGKGQKLFVLIKIYFKATIMYILCVAVCFMLSCSDRGTCPSRA